MNGLMPELVGSSSAVVLEEATSPGLYLAKWQEHMEME